VHDATSLFGLDAARFIGMIDQLALSKTKTRYLFTSAEDYARIIREDRSRGMQIYWGEILARTHMASVIAILRSRHWISAIVAATKEKNLLLFAAAFRGLIESSADTSSSLGSIPHTFARDHADINSALSGRLGKRIVIAREIEDELIHFSHARRLTKAELATTPHSHMARSIRDYIDILEKGQVHDVVACYQSLCDLTHPGACSVWMWLTSTSDLEFELEPNQNESEIAYYLTEYRKTFLQLLMFSFNPALLTLKVLNYFPLRTFHTSQLLNWDLSGIPIWKKCEREFGGALPNAREGLKRVKSNSPLSGL